MRKFVRAPPLRMEAHHERFGDLLARACARGEQRLGLAGVERDRLFAEHMLARLKRAQGPGHMQFVGQRIVDRLDRGIGEQFLVGAIGFGDAELGRGAPWPWRCRARRSRRRATARPAASPESLSRRRSWRRRARPRKLFSSSIQSSPLSKLALLPRSSGRRAFLRLTPPASACAAPAWRSSIQPGYSGVSALALSSAATSSAVRVTFTAARLSSSCSIVLAPMMTLITPGRCNSQASAICATDTPCALAIGAIASTMS